MESIAYNDQLGVLLVPHLLFDPLADLFVHLQPVDKLPTVVPGASPPQRRVERDALSSSSSDEEEAVGGTAQRKRRRSAGGAKFKRLQELGTDGSRYDLWERRIPDTLTLPEAALEQYAPLYSPARFVAEDPDTMGTSLDTALLMLRVAFDAKRRIDPQTFVITAGIVNSHQVFSVSAIKPQTEGPVVALSLNVHTIWRMPRAKVEMSMIYAALALEAFSKWWESNRERQPSVKEINRFLDTPLVVLKLSRRDLQADAAEYVPRFKLDPPTSESLTRAVIDGWVANAKARFGVPQIMDLQVLLDFKRGAKPRIDITSPTCLVCLNGLFDKRVETDVVQLLLVAFVRWCKRQLKFDAVGHYVNAGGRLDLLFSRSFGTTYINS